MIIYSTMNFIYKKIHYPFVFILVLVNFIIITNAFSNAINNPILNSNQKNEVLTWPTCVNELIKNNPQLQAEQQSIESNKYLLKAAYGDLYPQLSANVSYNYDTSENYSTTKSSTITTTSKSYNMSISATQNIFSGSKDYFKIQKAKANLNISHAKYNLLKAQLSYDLKSTYVELLFIQKLLKLNHEITNRRQENLSLVELRFEGGRENKGAVLLSQAYASQAQYDLLQNKENMRVAQSKLAKLLGRDEENTTSNIDFNFIVDENLYTSPIEKSKPDIKNLTKLTPSYMQILAEENSAKANLKITQSAFFPSLNLTGSKGRQGDHFAPNNDRWSLGITLSIPIFSGGKDYYTTKSAIEEVAITSANRRDVDLKLVVQLNEAYTNYLLAIEKYKVDQKFLEAAMIRAQIAKSKYNNGLISFDDWDIIENDLILRQKNVLQSHKSKIIAEAYWEEVQGKGVIP